MLVEVGQLRRWKVTRGMFVVLEPYAVPMLGDMTDAGWWVLLEDGTRRWIFEGDIELDSDVIEDT